MTISQPIRVAVDRALQDLKSLLPIDVDFSGEADVPLAEAAGGPLDSLGIVNLMVGVESAIEAETGRTLSLVDALAEPVDTSPFRSRAALETYLARLLDGEPGSSPGGSSS